MCYLHTSESLGGIADYSLHSSILEYYTSPFCDNLITIVILILSITFCYQRILGDPYTDITLKNQSFFVPHLAMSHFMSASLEVFESILLNSLSQPR